MDSDLVGEITNCVIKQAPQGLSVYKLISLLHQKINELVTDYSSVNLHVALYHQAIKQATIYLCILLFCTGQIYIYWAVELIQTS